MIIFSTIFPLQNALEAAQKSHRAELRQNVSESVKRLPSQSLTWNLKMAPWNRKSLLETINLRLHVELGECMWNVWLSEYLVAWPEATRQDGRLLWSATGWNEDRVAAAKSGWDLFFFFVWGKNCCFFLRIRVVSLSFPRNNWEKDSGIC